MSIFTYLKIFLKKSIIILQSIQTSKTTEEEKMNISAASRKTSLVCIEMPTSACLVLVAALKNMQKYLWPSLLEGEFYQNFCRDCGYHENQTKIVADFTQRIQDILNNNREESVKLNFKEVEWEFIWELIDNVLKAAAEQKIKNFTEIAGFLRPIKEEIDLNLVGSPPNIALN